METRLESKRGVRCLIMLTKLSSIVLLLVSSISVPAQKSIYQSPNKSLKAVIIPVGIKGYETNESRIEVRTSGRRLLQQRSFASVDHNHGEGVGHAEWTSDGQFFVFNTFSSGGHQPWHVATYFYSLRKKKFYSLDRFIGPISSDFKLEGSNTVVVTRLVWLRAQASRQESDEGERKAVKIALRNLRMNWELRAAPKKRLQRTRLSMAFIEK